MKVQENKGAIVNYYVHKRDGFVAKEMRYDYTEFLNAIEFMRVHEVDVHFDNEEDIEFVYDKEGKAEVADKVYNVEDYEVQLGTNVSLLVIKVYLKEIY